MKKILLFIFIIVLLACAGVFAYTCMANKEEYIKGEEKLYDIAVDYLNREAYKNDPIDTPESYRFFIAYEGLGITKKDEYKYVYMWVVGDGYYQEGNELKTKTGYSMFFKFQFKGNKIVKYENPKDGTEYADSIKKMCPDKEMSDKVINYKSELSNKKSAEVYYEKLNNPETPKENQQ